MSFPLFVCPPNMPLASQLQLDIRAYLQSSITLPIYGIFTLRYIWYEHVIYENYILICLFLINNKKDV